MTHIIKHASVKEGDLIRVTGKIGDMKVTREGVVAAILRNRTSAEYLTAQGLRLFAIGQSGYDLRELKITQLSETPDAALFTLSLNGDMHKASNIA